MKKIENYDEQKAIYDELDEAKKQLRAHGMSPEDFDVKLQEYLGKISPLKTHEEMKGENEYAESLRSEANKMRVIAPEKPDDLVVAEEPVSVGAVTGGSNETYSVKGEVVATPSAVVETERDDYPLAHEDVERVTDPISDTVIGGAEETKIGKGEGGAEKPVAGAPAPEIAAETPAAESKPVIPIEESVVETEKEPGKTVAERARERAEKKWQEMLDSKKVGSKQYCVDMWVSKDAGMETENRINQSYIERRNSLSEEDRGFLDLMRADLKTEAHKSFWTRKMPGVFTDEQIVRLFALGQGTPEETLAALENTKRTITGKIKSIFTGDKPVDKKDFSANIEGMISLDILQVKNAVTRELQQHYGEYYDKWQEEKINELAGKLEEEIEAEDKKEKEKQEAEKRIKKAEEIPPKERLDIIELIQKKLSDAKLRHNKINEIEDSLADGKFEATTKDGKRLKGEDAEREMKSFGKELQRKNEVLSNEIVALIEQLTGINLIEKAKEKTGVDENFASINGEDIYRKYITEQVYQILKEQFEKVKVLAERRKLAKLDKFISGLPYQDEIISFSSRLGKKDRAGSVEFVDEITGLPHIEGVPNTEAERAKIVEMARRAEADKAISSMPNKEQIIKEVTDTEVVDSFIRPEENIGFSKIEGAPKKKRRLRPVIKRDIFAIKEPERKEKFTADTVPERKRGKKKKGKKK